MEENFVLGGLNQLSVVGSLEFPRDASSPTSPYFSFRTFWSYVKTRSEFGYLVHMCIFLFLFFCVVLTGLSFCCGFLLFFGLSDSWRIRVPCHCLAQGRKVNGSGTRDDPWLFVTKHHRSVDVHGPLKPVVKRLPQLDSGSLGLQFIERVGRSFTSLFLREKFVYLT